MASQQHQKLPVPQRSQAQQRALPAPTPVADMTAVAAAAEDDLVLFDANLITEEEDDGENNNNDDLGDSYDAIAWTTPNVEEEQQQQYDEESFTATSTQQPTTVNPTQRALPTARSLPIPKQQGYFCGDCLVSLRILYFGNSFLS